MAKKIIPFIKEQWGLIPQPVRFFYRWRVNYLVKKNLLHKLRRRHFVKFIRGEHVTWQQWQVLLLIDNGNKKITVKTGHGVGKTAMIAWISIWYLCTREQVSGVCLAPTARMVFEIIHSETEVWIKRMNSKHLVYTIRQYLRLTGMERTSFIKYASQHEEALLGRCSENIITIIDEAANVRNDILYSHELYHDTNDLFILFSNPTNRHGYFWETHLKRIWEQVTLSSVDSPICRKDYSKHIKKLHGEESDEYKVRVLGQFPSELTLANKRSQELTSKRFK